MDGARWRNGQCRSSVSRAPFGKRGLLARTKPLTDGLRIKRKHHKIVDQGPGIRDPDLRPVVGGEAGVDELAQNFSEVRIDGASKASPIARTVERNAVTERSSNVTELAVFDAELEY